ncbi:MAG: type III pantothenate kinase [Bacteroidetes bacterium]|nr:type III pantothenate kinase [Bacteroidota bacterium]
MNLTLDIGNTRIKAGIFDGSILKESFVIAKYADLPAVIKKYPIKQIGVSSVVNSQEFKSNVPSSIPVLEFDYTTKIPLKNLYQTKVTLGNDRLVASIGAYSIFPNSNTLVIDAGTCIKYNFTNTRNEYLGGAISPGLNIRLRALHTFTDKLPLIESDFNFSTLIGTNTPDSILSGVMTASALEVKGFIEMYNDQFENVKVVLTGGDAPFFEKQLKNNIFADANLILKGLNTILLYNESNR